MSVLNQRIPEKLLNMAGIDGNETSQPTDSEASGEDDPNHDSRFMCFNARHNLIALVFVACIVIIAFIIVHYVNLTYRRDFERDYNKERQLYERCLQDDEIKLRY